MKYYSQLDEYMNKSFSESQTVIITNKDQSKLVMDVLSKHRTLNVIKSTYEPLLNPEYPQTGEDVTVGQSSNDCWLHDRTGCSDAIFEDVVSLNRNNNSSVLDISDSWTVSRSQSSFPLSDHSCQVTDSRRLPSDKAQHNSLRKRCTGNKRDKRSCRNQRRSNKGKPKVSKNRNQSLEEIQKTSESTHGAKQRANHSSFKDRGIDKHTNTKPNVTEHNTEHNSTNVEQISRSVCEFPARGSSNGADLHTGEHPNLSRRSHQSLRQMFQQLLQCRLVSEIPAALKQEILEIFCKPWIGEKLDHGRVRQLLRIADALGSKNIESVIEALDAILATHGINGGKIYPHKHPNWSNIYPPVTESVGKCENRTEQQEIAIEPFSSEYLFKHVFGPFYKKANHYWLVRPPVVPSQVVKYKRLADGEFHVIGSGTFGEVVEATLAINNQTRDIVLKEPFSDMVTRDQIFEEAKITMYLETTGYVPICYGLLRDDETGGHSIILEYFASGVTLKSVFAMKNLSRPHWLNIAGQLAEGLSRIHEMDVRINDIKADNVLVDLSGYSPVVKYCDMGCSSYRSGIVFQDTNMGFFQHLAPEVRAGGSTSKASDVYGLGKLLERIISVSMISGIVPVSEMCLRPILTDRITAAAAFSMLDTLHCDEVRCRSTTDTQELDHSTFDLSFEGYAPDSGKSSDSCSVYSAPLLVVKRNGGCLSDLYRLMHHDYHQARMEVYEKMCCVTNIDWTCLSVFVLMSFLLVFCRNTE